MDIENYKNLSLEQIHNSINQSNESVRSKQRKHKLTISYKFGLKATIYLINDEIIIKQKLPLIVLVFLAGGVITGTYYKDVFWGFFIGIAAAAIPYYLFYRKQMKEFNSALGRILV